MVSPEQRQKRILTFLLILLCLPTPLMVGFYFTKRVTHTLRWIANRSLYGVTLPDDKIPFTIKDWFKGNLQKVITEGLNTHFAGRELCIRSYNEILFLLFNMSYMSDKKLIICKDGTLFHRDYLKHYGGFSYYPPQKDLVNIAKKCKALQTALEKRGIYFVFIFSPTKPEFFPEHVPSRFFKTKDRIPLTPSDRERFLTLLNQYQIETIDGLAETKKHLAELPLPPFAKTGIHWTDAAASFTVNALLERIEKHTHTPQARVLLENPHITRWPGGPATSDADLAKLLNLVWLPGGRYLHGKFVKQPKEIPTQGNITFVGSSFLFEITDVLNEARVFEQMKHYFYYKLKLCKFPSKEVEEPVDEAKINWDKDFFQSNTVVLEATSAGLSGSYLPTFLDIALQKLGVNP